jgi:hypothetical protein
MQRQKQGSNGPGDWPHISGGNPCWFKSGCPQQPSLGTQAAAWRAIAAIRRGQLRVAMARRTVLRHIAPMADRPCKPGEDLKRLWRTLLPGTPFPTCGTPEESHDPAGDSAGAEAKDDNAERNGERGAVVR